MRMQSILVKPYVLECLNRFERERIEREAKEEAENPSKRIVFQSTKKQLAKLHEQMQRDKERKAKEEALKKPGQSEDEYEESESSSDEDQIDNGISQCHADVDAITVTPRATSFKNADFLVIVYEEGMDRVEMPSLKEQKMRAKKEAPVSKVHEKKNFKGINES